MRRIVIWTIAGISLLNLVGISIICIYFLNFSKEVERTVLMNRSLLVRTEVFEKSLVLLDALNKGRTDEARGLLNEINLRFSECYTCHHRDDTLARIRAANSLFERTSELVTNGRPFSSGDIAMVIQGFISYAFRKVKDSASAQTQSLNLFLGEIKRSVATTIGLTLIAFLFFSYYVNRRGRHLEKEIKEKEKVITDWALEWQNTFDAVQDMVIVLGEDLRPLVFNSASIEFFGPELYSKEILKTLNLDPSEINGPVSRNVEIKGRLFSLRLYPLSEAGKRCIIVLRDITRESELEGELKRTERLATLGIMAGGVAHEINNPLSPIVGYSEVLYELERDEQKRKYLRHIITAAQRIERIVKDLLFFAREQSLKIMDERIEDVIDGAIQNLDIVPTGDIEIIKELNYAGTVHVDRGLFEIALLNILKNAVQAIKEAKKGNQIRIITERQNGIINIKVSDNGPGIPKGIIPILFDPFFTTKDAGKGTGLGLSIAHRIITAHRGDIKVRSIEGEGTTFTITIPV